MSHYSAALGSRLWLLFLPKGKRLKQPCTRPLSDVPIYLVEGHSRSEDGAEDLVPASVRRLPRCRLQLVLPHQHTFESIPVHWTSTRRGSWTAFPSWFMIYGRKREGDGEGEGSVEGSGEVCGEEEVVVVVVVEESLGGG